MVPGTEYLFSFSHQKFRFPQSILMENYITWYRENDEIKCELEDTVDTHCRPEHETWCQI